MNPQLEIIKYGNPTREQLGIMQQVTVWDYLLPKMFEEVHCPSNISTLTHDELKELVEYQKLYNQLPEPTKKLYQQYDMDLVQAVSTQIRNSTGADISPMFQEIIADTMPLLLKLKYKHQRPRPYMLAYYYKQSIFPKTSISALSPSFPSGHIFQLTLLVETLGNKQPKLYDQLHTILSDNYEHRLFYGVHYPSDLDAARTLAMMIITSKEWTKKYNI
jgi:hypothetical protein